MKHIFYAGLDIRSKEPVDKRLYISDLTIASLQASFGDDGRYGELNAVTFNRTDKKFYALNEYASKADVINPAKWVVVGEGSIEFPTYLPGNAYNLGGCVTFEDSVNYEAFYIALGPVAIGESPETNPEKWLNISASSIATSPYELVEYRLDTRDPEGLATRDFVTNVSSLVSAAGTKIPKIMILADFDEAVSGNTVWTAIQPYYEFYTEGGVVKCRIIFTGDLSEIYYDNADSGQMNINIIFS